MYGADDVVQSYETLQPASEPGGFRSAPAVYYSHRYFRQRNITFPVTLSYVQLRAPQRYTDPRTATSVHIHVLEDFQFLSLSNDSQAADSMAITAVYCMKEARMRSDRSTSIVVDLGKELTWAMLFYWAPRCPVTHEVLRKPDFTGSLGRTLRYQCCVFNPSLPIAAVAYRQRRLLR